MYEGRQTKKVEWEEFLSFMKDTFQDRNHQQNINKKLRALRQLSSVKEYNRDFRMLSNQLTTMSELDKVLYFVEGLKESSLVGIHEPQTVDEAFQKAELLETYNVCGISNKDLKPRAVYMTENVQANQKRNTDVCEFCKKNRSRHCKLHSHAESNGRSIIRTRKRHRRTSNKHYR